MINDSAINMLGYMFQMALYECAIPIGGEGVVVSWKSKQRLWSAKAMMGWPGRLHAPVGIRIFYPLLLNLSPYRTPPTQSFTCIDCKCLWRHKDTPSSMAHCTCTMCYQALSFLIKPSHRKQVLHANTQLA